MPPAGRLPQAPLVTRWRNRPRVFGAKRLRGLGGSPRSDVHAEGQEEQHEYREPKGGHPPAKRGPATVLDEVGRDFGQWIPHFSLYPMERGRSDHTRPLAPGALRVVRNDVPSRYGRGQGACPRRWENRCYGRPPPRRPPRPSPAAPRSPPAAGARPHPSGRSSSPCACSRSPGPSSRPPIPCPAPPGPSLAPGEPPRRTPLRNRPDGAGGTRTASGAAESCPPPASGTRCPPPASSPASATKTSPSRTRRPEP